MKNDTPLVISSALLLPVANDTGALSLVTLQDGSFALSLDNSHGTDGVLISENLANLLRAEFSDDHFPYVQFDQVSALKLQEVRADQDFANRPEWIDTKGRKVAVSMVEPYERLVDEQVRAIHGFARDLMSRIARFRRHTHNDIGALSELLGEKYGMTPRGLKEGGRGNVSYKTYDGLMKVGISIQDYQEFGPELHIAKRLIDEFIHDVSEGVADEIKALLNHAFEVDKQGKIDRNMLYAVRRLNIQHPVFQRAVQAIKDSMRVASTREFITIEVRESTKHGFKALPINLANAFEVSDDAA